MTVTSTDPDRTSPGTVRLLGLSGSLRAASYNTSLLRAARHLAPEDVEVVLYPLHDLPFYNGDVEVGGLPRSVEALRTAIDAADGLLIATPEYNRSTTAVLKNAIDWASRGRPSPLDRKPTALLSAAGGSGGRWAQQHLRDSFVHNRVDVLDDAVQISRAWEHLEAGTLITEDHRQAVAGLVVALRDHIRSSRQIQAA